MSSLLSPFSFGQKNSYFHVQITIHELTNVPLVTGLFSCRWKIKGANSLSSVQHTATAAIQQSSSHGLSRKHAESSKDVGRLRHTSSRDGLDDSSAQRPASVHAIDRQSGFTDTTHSNASTPDVASITSRESSDPPKRKSAFLSNLIKKTKPTDDQDSSTPGSTDIDQDEAPRHSSQLSRRPSSRRESVNSRMTNDSRLTQTSKKSDRDLATSRQKQADNLPNHNMDPFLFFNQEPKGETETVKVAEHKVVWNRRVQVGLRIPIGKPKNPATHDELGSSSSHHPSPSVSAKSSARDLRAKHREHLNEPSSAWGRLSHSQVKLSIRQEMPPDTKSTTHLPTLGYVMLDLAEFAPNPPGLISGSNTPAHRHHHHHHHHHQHHHHHHHHSHGSDHSADRSSRSETRRFLLADSKTNATVRITVAMTYIGGSREYHVPPISSGLMVNGLGHIMDPTILQHYENGSPRKGEGSRQGSDSDSGSPRKESQTSGQAAETNVGGAHDMVQSSSASFARVNPSTPSLGNVYGPPLKSAYTKKTWHSRVPPEDLMTSSGANTERKRGSRDLERAHISSKHQHDRAPDDLIEAIFRGIHIGGTYHDRPVLTHGNSYRSTEQRSDRLKKHASTTQVAASGRPRPRPRTTSSASNISRLSERSFSFGLSSKPKEKKGTTASDSVVNTGKSEKEKRPTTASDSAVNSGKASSLSDFALELPNNAKSQSSSLRSKAKAKDTHLKVPDAFPSKVLTESPSTSVEALVVPGAANTPEAASMMSRQSSVRWDIGLDDDDLSARERGRDVTPTSEDPQPLRLDDAQRMRPPSVVVDHPYVPIRAGGVGTSSTVDLPLLQDDGAGIMRSASPQSGKTLTPDSESGTPADGPAPTRPERLRSQRLKDSYQAGPAIPATSSTGTAVGLDRLRKTGKALGKMAKSAVENARLSARPPPTATPETEGEKKRRLKGNRGIDPSEAASKGWHGAGWHLPVSAQPVSARSRSATPGQTDEASSPRNVNVNVEIDSSSTASHSPPADAETDGETTWSPGEDMDVFTPKARGRIAHARDDSFVSLYHDTDHRPSSTDGKHVQLDSSITSHDVSV